MRPPSQIATASAESDHCDSNVSRFQGSGFGSLADSGDFDFDGGTGDVKDVRIVAAEIIANVAAIQGDGSGVRSLPPIPSATFRKDARDAFLRLRCGPPSRSLLRGFLGVVVAPNAGSTKPEELDNHPSGRATEDGRRARDHCRLLCALGPHDHSGSAIPPSPLCH